MGGHYPFRTTGGWLREPVVHRPPLEGKAAADAIVVGAGFAGLNTSLELAARGAKVVLLERDHAGFGASGRNAGYLAGGQGLEYDFFLKRLGFDQASQIVGYYEEGVAFVERRLTQYDIDCDYLQTGIIRAAVHPSQEKRLRENMEQSVALGAPTRFIDGAELRARGIPAAFLFGSLTPNGGTLDPGKYALGLRRAALEAGVTIFEGTPLLSFTPGKLVRCKAPQGVAEAPVLVLATNAYTLQLDLLADRIVPLRVSAIETVPLTDQQLAALGWSGREGIVTPHLVMESLRLTARNTLVLTTKRLDYLYGGKTPNEPADSSYRALEQVLRQRLPEVGDIAIASAWNGYISFALDALPLVGATGKHANVYFAAGCSGHGVGTQSLAGEVLADRVSGTPNRFDAALDHVAPRVPSEPVRSAMMKGALAGAHLLDRLTDWRARCRQRG